MKYKEIFSRYDYLSLKSSKRRQRLDIILLAREKTIFPSTRYIIRRVARVGQQCGSDGVWRVRMADARFRRASSECESIGDDEIHPRIVADYTEGP